MSEERGHLQKDAEKVADIIRAMFCETLRTIAALKQKCLAFGNIRELVLQLAGFTCKYERWIGTKASFNIGQSLCVWIKRHLLDRFVSPGIRGPVLRHFTPVLIIRAISLGFCPP
jgi:hypothetical protein